MITKINHIGIAVRNIEEAVRLYTEALGLKLHEIETVEAYRVKVAMIPVGESKIELVQPTDSEGAVAKYIEKRGEGLHHLACDVGDYDQAVAALKKQGIGILMSGSTELYTFAYMDTEKHLGTIIEIYKPPRGTFDMPAPEATYPPSACAQGAFLATVLHLCELMLWWA